MDKIKVVWICHLSNEQIREQLRFDKYTPYALMRRVRGNTCFVDFAIWNSNAIREFEKFDDIELHIVAPHVGIHGTQEFCIKNVHYHFFKSEDDNFFEQLRLRVTGKIKTTYLRNTKQILKFIRDINPDIIHMIGAENPYYGESGLYLPQDIPLIVTPQTFMNDPDFVKNYPISKIQYDFRSSIERAIIQKADFVGTKSEAFRAGIRKYISDNVKFLDITLALGVKIDNNLSKKYYDFVYFAADISKAADYAIEAFAKAKQYYPDISLHVVGGYCESFLSQLKARMKELGLDEEVDFTGRLQTHDDVINEIRKARYAILPLKVDLIAGTIREAMANGLPVVSTITPATPELNMSRESILLSEKGDFDAMAENMCKLLSDDTYAEMIRRNAAITIDERYSNKTCMQKWRTVYFDICHSINDATAQ